MELFIKLALLLFSLVGYYLWFSKEYRIRIELMPAIFCASVSNILFLAGVLNLLQETAYLIFAVGYLLLIRCLIRKYWKDIRVIIVFGVFAICIGYFCLYFRGIRITSYDDFSHWMLVVRSMLLSERMPMEGSLVGFQSYPLGSSLFIYYICNILGSTEACYLWAQIVMYVSMILAVGALIDRHSSILVQLAYAVSILLFGIYCLIMNVPIQSLCVDTLLSLGTIAGLAVIISTRELPETSMILLGIFCVFLTNTKNSGLFFAATLMMMYVLINRKAVRYTYKRVIWCGVLPAFFAWLIWNRHVDLVFSSAAWSKHAMNLERFGAMAMEKTPEICRQILEKQSRAFLSLDDILIKMLLLSFIAIELFALLCTERAKIKQHIRWLIMLVTLTILYQIGIAAMYILSMPTGEAVMLASYDRYERSLALFVLGADLIYILCAVNQMQKTSAKYIASMCIVMTLVCVPLYHCRDRLSGLYNRPDFSLTERYRLQQVINEADLEVGKGILVYRKQTDYDYLRNVCRYEFWTDHCAVVNSMEEFSDLLDDYEYAVLWDCDHDQLKWLSENQLDYKDVYGTIVITQ